MADSVFWRLTHRVHEPSEVDGGSGGVGELLLHSPGRVDEEDPRVFRDWLVAPSHLVCVCVCVGGGGGGGDESVLKIHRT